MKITEAKPVDRFHVFLRFDDGASGTVGLSYFAGRGEQPFPCPSVIHSAKTSN